MFTTCTVASDQVPMRGHFRVRPGLSSLGEAARWTWSTLGKTAATSPLCRQMAPSAQRLLPSRSGRTVMYKPCIQGMRLPCCSGGCLLLHSSTQLWRLSCLATWDAAALGRRWKQRLAAAVRKRPTNDPTYKGATRRVGCARCGRSVRIPLRGTAK